MATTNNVPSDNFEDLLSDVRSITKYMNGDQEFQTRTGRQITPLPAQQSMVENLIRNSGFQPVGNFATGATITAVNQVLFNNADSCYYNWQGAVPFTVPAGTNPTANAGPAAWVNRGNILSQVTSVSCLKDLAGVTPVHGQQFSVISFYSGWAALMAPPASYGLIVYNATISKSKHNGVSVITPEAINYWDGSYENLNDLFLWTGNGQGAFINISIKGDSVNLFQCGAQLNKNVAFIVNHIYSSGFIEACADAGNYYIEDTITVPHNHRLTGASSELTVFKLRASMVDSVVIKYGQNYFYQGFKGSLKSFRVEADGAFDKRGVGVLFTSGCDVEDVAMFELKSAFVLSGNDYVDKISIKRCYVGYCGGHALYHTVHIDGPCDAVQIEQLSFQLSYNPEQPVSERDGVFLSRCRGGVLSSNIINGFLRIRRCDAIMIIGHHKEGSQRDDYFTSKTRIVITRSNVTIDGAYLHKSEDGPTIKLQKETAGASHETSSLTLKNTIIDTTILLKDDLAGKDVPDIELDGNSIVNIENVYRQETYAFAQTQPKTGIKVQGSDVFNAHASLFSKRCTIHPDGRVDSDLKIGFNGVPQNYNRNQFSNSNPNLPFYESGASDKTFFIRTVLVVDDSRKLATNRNSTSQQINNVNTGSIGVGRGILVNTVNSPVTDGRGAIVYYYRGESANVYNKLAKAPVVIAQFTYDTGLDYQGYPLEARAPSNIDDFNYIYDYHLDANGNAVFTMDSEPLFGNFVDGDILLNKDKEDWEWQRKIFINGEWVNTDFKIIKEMLDINFAPRYAAYMNGSSSFGEFQDRLVNPDGDIYIEFSTGLVVLNRSQAILAQQRTVDPTLREFLLVANTNNTFGFHVGGLSVTTGICKLSSFKKYKIEYSGELLRFYENDQLIENIIFPRGAAREPDAKTTVGAAYTSISTRLLFFRGQIFNLTISGSYYPLARVGSSIQYSSPVTSNLLNLNFINENDWVQVRG